MKYDLWQSQMMKVTLGEAVTWQRPHWWYTLVIDASVWNLCSMCLIERRQKSLEKDYSVCVSTTLGGVAWGCLELLNVPELDPVYFYFFVSLKKMTSNEMCPVPTSVWKIYIGRPYAFNVKFIWVVINCKISECFVFLSTLTSVCPFHRNSFFQFLIIFLLCMCFRDREKIIRMAFYKKNANKLGFAT